MYSRPFFAFFDSEMDEESNQSSNTKIAELTPDSKTQKTEVNTPIADKNYLALKEKLEMRTILENEITEERDPIEMKNMKISDYLGDPLGSDPDFVAKFGSDSATDSESDKASNEKPNKTAKSMPCPKTRITDVNTPNGDLAQPPKKSK